EREEYTEDTPDSRDSCSPTNSFSVVGSPVNSESPSDIHTVREKEWLCSPFAETHKQEVGQEKAFLMSALVCCDVTDGGDQTQMDLPLWEVDSVLKVELWNMAKWQLSQGSTLLAEDVWLSGVRVPLQPGQSFKFTVLETLDRIKEEFQFLQAQYHSLKLECEKLASEKTEMQRHYIMYYEMSYGLNIEMHKQLLLRSAENFAAHSGFSQCPCAG
ncbi:putative transducin-like enhancer protein 2, partial [Triplophysa rosa]